MQVTEKEADEIIQPIRKTDLIYQIEDKPPFSEAMFAGFQHLLALFVAELHAGRGRPRNDLSEDQNG